MRPIAIPCLALSVLLGGAGGLSMPPTGALEAAQAQAKYISPSQRLRPLMDLLATGEGHYDSVNRRWANDTPGGIKWLKGRSFSTFTVGEVIWMQRWQIYAVGRYQMIPSTLLFAVRHSDVKTTDKFTPEVQDRLMVALVQHKRPDVWAYLRGEHNNIEWAMDQLAREWASVEHRHGRGYWDHVGGNRAKISRAQLKAVLTRIRNTWQG